jgi:hypothetical protein
MDSEIVDSEKGGNQYIQTPFHVSEIVVDPSIVEQWKAMSSGERDRFEKKLVRKLDWRIIPWVSLLYLLSFLDRTNIGNAKIQGVRTLKSLKADSTA